MLTGVFRKIINKLYYEIFNITFMKNIKSCQQNLLFPHKGFRLYTDGSQITIIHDFKKKKNNTT